MQTFNSFLQDTSLLWIRTRMQLNGFSSGEDHQKINFQTFILNPLQQQYMSSQSMSVWNYMLGMIQTGAFGYLAYEHLKKYGFLKRINVYIINYSLLNKKLILSSAAANLINYILEYSISNCFTSFHLQTYTMSSAYDHRRFS